MFHSLFHAHSLATIPDEKNHILFQ